MKIEFVKYQGTGNDFVMIDNRSGKWNDLAIEDIRRICDRRFGVGADGLILLNSHSKLDFEVDYYNSDGSKSFCGNGARCAVAFAKTLGFNTSLTHFIAIDGEHEASQKYETVSLLMKDVSLVRKQEEDYIIDTGSPHYIQFGPVEHLHVYELGKKIRYSDQFRAEGINVNFVEIVGVKHIRVRTYERGVEDETLSCGTGVTAAALAYAVKENLHGEQLIDVSTSGGDLKVHFSRTGDMEFERIFLIGPAKRVFEGTFGE